MEGRNVGTIKRKNLEQDLTSAKDQTIELTEGHEWIARPVQKLVDICNLPCSDYYPSDERNPSPGPPVLHKLMTSCSYRERNPVESHLEISEAMLLVKSGFSYLEKRCSGISEHSDGDVPELRRARTTFDGEYLDRSSSILGNTSLRNIS